MKKIIIAVGLLFSVALCQASENSKSVIYANGVKDTLSLGEDFFKDIEVFSNPDRVMLLNGYVVFLNASEMFETDIVRLSAISRKNDFKVSFVELMGIETIVFTVASRRADAVYVQKRLSLYKIPTRIKKLNVEVRHINLVARKMIEEINYNIKRLMRKKDKRIATLEGLVRETVRKRKGDILSVGDDEPVVKCKKSEKCKPCKQSKCKKQPIIKKEIIKIGRIQVVNRVITKKYLEKMKALHKTVKPINNTEEKTMTIEKVNRDKRVVARNIRRDANKALPIITSFSKAFRYIKKHGAITDSDKLVLHGKTYDSGDTLWKWKVSSVNKKTGLVILDDSYAIQVNE